MQNRDTGYLLNDKNIKLHRAWFKQMTRLLGIRVKYRAPRDSSKTYTGYGEFESFYYEPEEVMCIFDEHPNQSTFRKLGWNAELADTSVVIHVPYDLQGLQVGALFEIPGGLDDIQPRLFRVLRMTNIAIYPASIACELGPLLPTNTNPSTFLDFESSNFNLLNDESDDYGM